MMLTCHLTQNNVNIEIFYLCMVDVIFITTNWTLLWGGHKRVGHSSEQFKNLCTFSDYIFSTLPLHNINILPSFSSHPTPSQKLNVKFFLSVICVYKLFFGGHFSQFNLFTNTTSANFCNFWLHSQLVDILSPKM